MAGFKVNVLQVGAIHISCVHMFAASHFSCAADLLSNAVPQEMAAMDVAQLMHQLFTRFDYAVTESGLYKV